MLTKWFHEKIVYKKKFLNLLQKIKWWITVLKETSENKNKNLE